MKKLIALTGAAALLLSITGGVLAHHRRSGNSADITNTTTAISDTGVIVGNSVSVEKAHISGEIEVKGDNEVKKVHTGDADSLAVGVVVANTDVNLDCDSCTQRGSRNNRAEVDNTTIAQSVTGVEAGNSVYVEKAHVDGDIEVGGRRDENEVKKVHTGSATADAYGVVLVNTRFSTDW